MPRSTDLDTSLQPAPVTLTWLERAHRDDAKLTFEGMLEGLCALAMASGMTGHQIAGILERQAVNERLCQRQGDRAARA